MAFNVENASGAALAVDDLGITLETGEIIDLAQQGQFDTILVSLQTGNEINNLITSGDLIVKDPLLGTDLIIADALLCVLSFGDPHYRVGVGARIGDVSDVTLTAPADGEVLAYNIGSGNWVNSPNGGVSGDVPAALARRTTAMPITNAFVTITFDTTDLENDDTVIDHDNVTNTSRITVKETGLYEIYFQASGLEFTANGEGFYSIESRLIKNGVLVAIPGADIVSSGYTGGAATTTEVNAPNSNIILELVANDYLEVQIRFVVLNGQTGTVGSATADSTFWVAKLAGAKGDAGTDGTDGAAGPTGSGVNINVYEEGTIVPNSPFSELNFIGDAVTATDAGAGRTNITITGGQVDFDRQGVQTLTTFATSSPTTVDITGSTLTTKDLGAVGDYVITFSCEYQAAKNDRSMTCSIDVGGSIVYTLRATGDEDKGSNWRNFSMTHLEPAVAFGTIIKAVVLSENSEAITIETRQLVIDGVLSSNVLI